MIFFAREKTTWQSKTITQTGNLSATEEIVL